MSKTRVRLRGSLLSVIGAINWDMNIFEERFAKAGEEVSVRAVEECSGGKGANVAVAAARILGRQRVALLGALGDDELCKRQLAELEREGVMTSGVLRVSGCHSGRAYILVDSAGRKTIHTHFGANERVTPQSLLSGEGSRLLAETGMMIVMDPPTSVGLTAARVAKRIGAKVIYSPGVRTQEGLEAIVKIIELSDILVVDRVELMNLFRVKSEDEALGAVHASKPGMTVVTTLGERGCVVTKDGHSAAVSGVDLASLGKRAVNTTGCGDAFLGAFAGYLLMKHQTLDSANWGNLAGALKAARYETRGSPTRVELESAMKVVEGIRQERLGLPESTAS